MLEFLSKEIFLLKDMLLIGQKKSSLLIRLKVGEEIIGSFYGKELQKPSQKEFRIEKILKRKGDKLYVKWKGYDNSFNSWINKKDIL